jgi:predicted YcjX-like family ATPase
MADQGSTAAGARWDHPNHQFYLHHSDQPGAVLVPQSLVEDNYSTWSQSMTMALTVKNKIGFIDGSMKEPDEKKFDEHQQ